MLTQETCCHLGRELFLAMETRQPVPALTDRLPDMDLGDAYAISRAFLDQRLQGNGERVIGKKIGVTSQAVQDMLGVFEPDFGFLTDAMLIRNASVETGRLIQPRAEAELAFVLKQDLQGPGVTAEQVLEATDYVTPCFEIVDSRIEGWKIKIQDTVADNASCGVFVLGRDRVDPRNVDLSACVVKVHKNGRFLSEGRGAAVQGAPQNAVAWLANTLGAFGIPFKAGEIILSGSLVPLEPVEPGDVLHMSVPGIGEAKVQFK
ncbi:fumarylacetoacetate hydrolase family protein [Luteithermobacter gelatinilyticus]|uniref:fumarylacetoacetate hydrolase family protein n=1 Tax=Luteithermobacter gelatinilyticus TaxID=2582913 RepID=UPI0011074703|nr:fumarylacetoacetate hydrolase family protein [Luteithermobacter gelatinilyticus]